jgi:outer membrane protein assembly factor BamB
MNFKSLLVIAILLAVQFAASAAENWPCFRGPTGQGVSAEKDLPLTWSLNENVAWRTVVGGTGWSSPIVWGDRVFLTATTADEASGRVLCIDRDTGKILWDKKVVDRLPDKKQPKNSNATPTPITDGKAVYAVFNGLNIVALDFDGNTLWKHEDPAFSSMHGLGASPILYKNVLIMPCDGNDPADRMRGFKQPWEGAFVVALDIKTGQEKWRARRGLSRQAHVTPKVIDVAGRPLLVSAGGDVVQGFDPDKGELLWTVKSQGEGVVPSIVYADGLVYTCSGYEAPTIRAIRPDGRGDVTATHVAWESTKDVPMMPSFLYNDGLLFCVKETGVATCLEAHSGTTIWNHRLGGKYSASPVLAAGRVYCLAEDGTTVVFAAGREYKELARNALEGMCQASPAISGGRILVRAGGELYCVTDQARSIQKVSHAAGERH